jgi:hypothetical protein
MTVNDVMFSIRRLYVKVMKEITSESFIKYSISGIIVMIISMILTTAILYIGREMFFISLLILNPITKVIDWLTGFILKYTLYKKMNILK